MVEQLNLDEVLATLRKHGVASAEVPSEHGCLRVVFEPGASPLPKGDEVTPGGWKGPDRLDSDPFGDRSVP